MTSVRYFKVHGTYERYVRIWETNVTKQKEMQCITAESANCSVSSNCVSRRRVLPLNAIACLLCLFYSPMPVLL